MPRLDRKDGLSSPRKSFTVNVPPCHEVFAAELVWRFWVPIRRAIGRAIKTALWVEYEMLKHLPSEIELLRTLYSKLWAPFGHARDWLDDRRAALASALDGSLLARVAAAPARALVTAVALARRVLGTLNRLVVKALTANHRVVLPWAVALVGFRVQTGMLALRDVPLQLALASGAALTLAGTLSARSYATLNRVLLYLCQRAFHAATFRAPPPPPVL